MKLRQSPGGYGGSGGDGGGGAGPGGFLGRRPAKGHPALPELEEAEYRALDPGPARVAGRTTFRWPRLVRRRLQHREGTEGLTRRGFGSQHWLAFKGLASEAAEIIAEEVDLRSVDATINMTNAEKMLCENVTPLYLAAQEGRLAMVRLLLKHGAQPDLAVSAAPARRGLGTRMTVVSD